MPCGQMGYLLSDLFQGRKEGTSYGSNRFCLQLLSVDLC